VASSGKPKAVRRLVLSSMFAAGLVVVGVVDTDSPWGAVAIVSAVILGFPFVLLSSIDLGRVLRSEHEGDFRSSKATWLLSQVQAGFGAVCMAAGAYAVYVGINAWRDSTVNFQGAMSFLGIPMGLGCILVGFQFIRSAFVPERREMPRNDT
jgi:hypothetical protein